MEEGRRDKNEKRGKKKTKGMRIVNKGRRMKEWEGKVMREGKGWEGKPICIGRVEKGCEQGEW